MNIIANISRRKGTPFDNSIQSIYITESSKLLYLMLAVYERFSFQPMILRIKRRQKGGVFFFLNPFERHQSATVATRLWATVTTYRLFSHSHVKPQPFTICEMWFY